MQNPLALPSVSAELVGYYVARCAEMFTTATITVDFSQCPVTEDDSSALLLTLSPLHEVCAVRVLVQMESTTSTTNLVTRKNTWLSLRLDKSTLYPTTCCVVSPGDARLQESAAEIMESGAVKGSDAEDERESATRHMSTSQENMDDEVLELFLGTSDAGEEEEEEEDKEKIEHLKEVENTDEERLGEDFPPFTLLDPHTTASSGRQFLLSVSLAATEGGTEVSENVTSRCILRCSVDVALASGPLATGSYPHITTVCGITASVNTNSPVRSDAFVLLVGQRFYDYYICPRVAYAASKATSTFAALDVNVTDVAALPGAEGGAVWDVICMTSLPIAPRNILCAFVQPAALVATIPTRLIASRTSGVEIHSGVHWRVTQHPAYTLLASTVFHSDSISGVGGEVLLYFFHCDHTLCVALLPLLRIAREAWMKSQSGDMTGPECWVIVGGSSGSTLLSLRRGALCVCGGAMLSADTVRSLQSREEDAIRAQVAVLSAALELRWRGVNRVGNAGDKATPEFDTFPASSALVRAWALCLLSSAPKWISLLREERCMASRCRLIMNKITSMDPWCLTERYIQEIFDTFVLLSSAFLVASLRFHICSPWKLFLERQSLVSQSIFLDEGDVSPLSGLPISLVRRLILRASISPVGTHAHGLVSPNGNGNGAGVGGGNSAALERPPPLLLLGTLNYEERLSKENATCRDLLLHLRFNQSCSTLRQSPFGDESFASSSNSSTLGIDVPFAVVYFSVSNPGQRISQCRVAHRIHCCWRLQGLSWVRGVDQHTTFSILMDPNTSYETNSNHDNGFADGCGKEDEEENEENIFNDTTETMGDKKILPVCIPFLVLNPKTVPLVLGLNTQHEAFWSDSFSLSPMLAQAVRITFLQRIMDQALREAEEGLDEVALIFTPLLNSLLEDILNSQSVTRVELHKRLVLFLTSMSHTKAEALWQCIYSDLHIRVQRLTAQLPPIALTNAALRRCHQWGKRSKSEVNLNTHNAEEEKDNDHEDVEEDDEKENDKGVGLKYKKQDEDAVTAAMRRLVRQVIKSDAMHASGTQQQEQPQQHQEQQRKVLRLSRRSVANPTCRIENESLTAPSPSKFAAILTRGISAGITVMGVTKESTLSLLIPLWLLLRGRSPLLGKEVREEAEEKVMHEIYTSLQACEDGVDEFLLKAYEPFAGE